MKVGSLIKYFNPPNKQVLTFDGLTGLVVGYDHEAQGSPNIEGRGMVQVLFNGFTLLRWVHEQDCEVIA
jgi:hypothetical protein